MTAQHKMAATADAGPFVLNLCSSTTPMALAQPEAPELKRFSFFVSRRREEGRERFRLHMGYFLTLAEAEEWLNVVRDIYPGAWAGETPGKRLAERAAAAAAPRVPAAPVAPVTQVAPPPPVKPVVAPRVAASGAPANVPTVHAAPNFPLVPKVAASKAPPAVIAKPVAPPARPQPSAPQPAMPPPKASASPPAAPPKAPQIGSNVREVLKSLDDSGATRAMPLPSPAAASLSDSQVLKILESRRADSHSRVNDEGSKGIALLRPDDTATVRALKEAVHDNAPVSFAVQLQWSVQPIDLVKMPPLAIFSAYTLYTVEGSRDGRKWYGLRLGFFGDAISAKQVASYVRSEFTSVAVIPVSAQELDRATDGDEKSHAGGHARPRKPLQQPTDEFKLSEDQTDDVVMPGLAAAQAQLTAKKAPAPAARHAANKPGRKAAGRVRATEKRSPKTLEETLEILGASDLEIDNGRGEFLNDSGVRHLRMEVQKNSPFSKLLERLSERVRKS